MAIELSEKIMKHEFIVKINELSGQDIFKCFQCGTCGGACPMSEEMEILPRKIMRMLQLGMVERISGSETGWECASCHSCSVTCSRGIDLARVMEAVRLMVLRKNINKIERKNRRQNSLPWEDMARPYCVDFSTRAVL